MIDLPKRVKHAKTFKTFIKRLEAHCLSQLKKDPSIGRLYLQVFFEICRIYGMNTTAWKRIIKQCSKNSLEGTYDTLHALRKSLEEEKDGYIHSLQLLRAGHRWDVQEIRRDFADHPKNTASKAVTALFFVDHEQNHRTFSAKELFEAATKYLSLFVYNMKFFDPVTKRYDWNPPPYDGDVAMFFDMLRLEQERKTKNIDDELVFIISSIMMETDTHRIRGSV